MGACEPGIGTFLGEDAVSPVGLSAGVPSGLLFIKLGEGGGSILPGGPTTIGRPPGGTPVGNCIPGIPDPDRD